MSSPTASTAAPTSRPRKIGRLLLLPALIVAAVMLPAITLHATHTDGFWDSGLSFSIGDQSSSTIDTAHGSISMRVNGAVTFNQQETNVKQVDGKATIFERRGDKTFRIELTNDAQQHLKQRYWVNGNEQQFDAEGQQWLASAIPVVVREAGIDAEKRVARLLKKGGADAVLAEIELIDSSFARSRYINLLSSSAKLDAPRLQRLLNATNKIDSDFELRGNFLSLIEQQQLTPEMQVMLLNSTAEKMDSDFERRSVLQGLSPKLTQDSNVTLAWRKVIEKMDSDFEARSAIDAFAGREELTATQIDAALHATRHIDSDFEHRSALEGLVKHLKKADPTLISSYLASARKIDSDFERKSALMTLLKQATLGKSDYGQLLDSLTDMESDFEVGSVLKAMAKQMPADQELISHYRMVAQHLGDFEREQAEKALSRLN